MFVKRFGDQYKVFEKFGGHIFKRRIVISYFDSHIHHIERVCAHPTGTVCLFKLHFAGEMKVAVEHTDVIETKKSAFEDVVAVHIFPVDPPGEVDDEFVEYL